MENVQRSNACGKFIQTWATDPCFETLSNPESTLLDDLSLSCLALGIFQYACWDNWKVKEHLHHLLLPPPFQDVYQPSILSIPSPFWQRWFCCSFLFFPPLFLVLWSIMIMREEELERRRRKSWMEKSKFGKVRPLTAHAAKNRQTKTEIGLNARERGGFSLSSSFFFFSRGHLSFWDEKTKRGLLF